MDVHGDTHRALSLDQATGIVCGHIMIKSIKMSSIFETKFWGMIAWLSKTISGNRTDPFLHVFFTHLHNFVIVVLIGHYERWTQRGVSAVGG